MDQHRKHYTFPLKIRIRFFLEQMHKVIKPVSLKLHNLKNIRRKVLQINRTPVDASLQKCNELNLLRTVMGKSLSSFTKCRSLNSTLKCITLPMAHGMFVGFLRYVLNIQWQFQFCTYRLQEEKEKKIS